MSHYTTVVLVDGSLDMQEAVDTAKMLLAPFDEGLRVPEYETDCWCVGNAARREAAERLEEAFPLRTLRSTFEPPFPEPENEDQIDACRKAWEEHTREASEFEKAVFEAHPLKNQPDPECGFYTERFHKNAAGVDDPSLIGTRYEDGSGCGGTGRFKTTRNPDAKWDYRTVGGRYEGRLGGKNVAPVSEILDYTPFAIVDPQGNWFEKGEMGWWGVASNVSENWKAQAREILERHIGCTAVLFDCHI